MGARVNHAAAAIAAAAGGVGRRVVILNNNVGKSGEAGPIQGVEHGKAAALTIEDRIVLDGDALHCQCGVPGAGSAVAARIEIESSAEAVLIGAAVTAIVPVL